MWWKRLSTESRFWAYSATEISTKSGRVVENFWGAPRNKLGKRSIFTLINKIVITTLKEITWPNLALSPSITRSPTTKEKSWTPPVEKVVSRCLIWKVHRTSSVDLKVH